MRKLFLPLILLFILRITSQASSDQSDSTITFLPDNRIFPVIFLDPLECQIMGGSYFLSHSGEDLSLYSTVNLGFSLPVMAGRGEKISWELNFGTAIFKLSGDFSLRMKNDLLRLRFFHMSSHLGDDFMLRHPDTLQNDKSANYEQADLTYLRMFRDSYLYAGAGGIYTKYIFRERFSLYGGGVYNFGIQRALRYFTGLDVKVLEENDWYPDIRTTLGINIRRHSEPLIRIWMEYYSGHLPYSTIDYGRVNWFGMAMALNIFK
jgi:hypothetical protein